MEIMNTSNRLVLITQEPLTKAALLTEYPSISKFKLFNVIQGNIEQLFNSPLNEEDIDLLVFPISITENAYYKDDEHPLSFLFLDIASEFEDKLSRGKRVITFPPSLITMDHFNAAPEFWGRFQKYLLEEFNYDLLGNNVTEPSLVNSF